MSSGDFGLTSLKPLALDGTAPWLVLQVKEEICGVKDKNQKKLFVIGMTRVVLQVDPMFLSRRNARENFAPL